MRAVTRTTVEPRIVAAFVWGSGLALLFVLWSFGFALGGVPGEATEDAANTDFADFDSNDDAREIESFTMSISLEEDGVINLDAPATDVKIERWQGDEVLVIVEKSKRPSSTGKCKSGAEPVNIHVTRHGKDVRIQTTGGSDWKESGMDLSFRIVLPGRYQITTSDSHDGDTMTRLTSTFWRALQKEALKWLVR
ncbi:MAG: hypothetical protein P8181_01265 [bacterium]